MTIKMKQLLILIAACLLWPLGAFAQYEEDTENGVGGERRFFHRHEKRGFCI